MKIILRTIALLLIFNLIFVAFGETLLDIDTCRRMTLENSFELKSVKMDLIKKDIEKNQAIEGIKDIRKKESTVRFSLLFNIEFPEKHGMPKEIKLVMKIPQIEREISVLKEKYKYEQIKAINSLDMLYFDILLKEYEIENYGKLLEESNKALEVNNFRVATGLGDPEDIKYLEKSYGDLEKEYRTALMDYQNKKENMGKLIGIEINENHKFDDSALIIASVEREDLKDILNFALSKDFNLFKEKKETELAIRNVKEISSIYKKQFSSKVNVLDSQLRKSEIDIDTFYEKYKEALDNIDSPWRRYYKINMLFFTIKIPYRWFQGEYDGLRYFEDEKYALFLAVVDREKQIKKEEDARDKFVQSVRNNYNNLKNSEIAYLTAKEQMIKAEEDYNNKADLNKIGRLSLQELDKASKEFVNSQNSLYSLLIDYNKSLSSFNFQVSGYLDKYFGNESVEKFDLESGISNKVDEGVNTWYVKNSIDDYKFTFGIRLGDDSDYTHYELYTNQNYRVGEKVEIDKEISHLPIAFENASSFYVKLYSDKLLKAIGEFEGDDYTGTLEIQDVENNKYKVGTYIGSYEFESNNIYSSLKVKVNEDISASGYKVKLGEKNLSDLLELDKEYRSLSLLENDIEKMEIELYKDDNLIYKTKLYDKNIVVSE